mgnify:CR=1 FL=1
MAIYDLQHRSAYTVSKIDKKRKMVYTLETKSYFANTDNNIPLNYMGIGPGLFWRSKCGKQGGRSLNERCAIKDKESSKIK